jgi:hypothetical protein
LLVDRANLTVSAFAVSGHRRLPILRLQARFTPLFPVSLR